MSGMRRSRLTGIAAVVAMMMAVLAVCPCPPTVADASGDPHGCCAGKAGLTIAPDTGSCCADEERDNVAVSAVPVPVAAGWPTAVLTAVAALPVPPLAAASAPPRTAPHILRI